MVREVQRWSRVRNIVNNYHDLRAMCCQFLNSFPEAVANNEYKAVVRLLEQDTVQVVVLGETVQLSFDYIVQDGEVHGAIRCEQLLPKNEKRLLVRHYIDWNGYAYETIAGEKPFQGLHSPKYPTTILFLICEALIAQHTLEGSNA